MNYQWIMQFNSDLNAIYIIEIVLSNFLRMYLISWYIHTNYIKYFMNIDYDDFIEMTAWEMNRFMIVCLNISLPIAREYMPDKYLNELYIFAVQYKYRVQCNYARC